MPQKRISFNSKNGKGVQKKDIICSNSKKTINSQERRNFTIRSEFKMLAKQDGRDIKAGWKSLIAIEI